MNVRSLVKLQNFSLKYEEQSNPDNFYVYKVEIWHGDQVHPYHESCSFTKEELMKWIENLNKLSKSFSMQINHEMSPNGKND